VRFIISFQRKPQVQRASASNLSFLLKEILVRKGAEKGKIDSHDLVVVYRIIVTNLPRNVNKKVMKFHRFS
jgi:hypothetical protein